MLIFTAVKYYYTGKVKWKWTYLLNVRQILLMWFFPRTLPGAASVSWMFYAPAHIIILLSVRMSACLSPQYASWAWYLLTYWGIVSMVSLDILRHCEHGLNKVNRNRNRNRNRYLLTYWGIVTRSLSRYGLFRQRQRELKTNSQIVSSPLAGPFPWL